MRIRTRSKLEREHLAGHARDIIAALALPFEVSEGMSDTVVRCATNLLPEDVIASFLDRFKTAWREVEMARTPPAGVSGSCEQDAHALCAVAWCGCVCHPVRAARVMVDDLVEWGVSKNASAQTKRVFGGKESCHLTVDGPLVVLHALAERIGMRRVWFQPHPLMHHYDLTSKRREAALAAGAVYVPGMEQARARRAKRRAAEAAKQGPPT